MTSVWCQRHWNVLIAVLQQFGWSGATPLDDRRARFGALVRCLSLGFEEAFFEGIADQFGAVMEVELFHNALAISIHRLAR